jgi:putative DNA primase/helicase
MPEPEKVLELNTSLIKQPTGGDTITARAMYEEPVEIAPEFKPFIHTTPPRTSDDSIFASGRVKVIPFERHFSESEQDTGLKKHFRLDKAKSAILNWLLDGHRLETEVGLAAPARVTAAVAEYRQETDVIGVFLSEHTVEAAKSRLPTSELYGCYTLWAKDNGYNTLNARNFVGELRRRCDVRKDSGGNVVVGLALSYNTGLPA